MENSKYETLSDLLRSGKSAEELGISDETVLSPRMSILEFNRRIYEEQRTALAELRYKTFIG